MIRYQQAGADSLRQFVEWIQGHGFARIVEALLEGIPKPLVRRAIRELANTPKPDAVSAELWPALSLVLFGQPHPEAEIRLRIGDVLDGLLQLGLLEKIGQNIFCDRYAIIPIEGLPFIVSRLHHQRSQPNSIAVYFGQDTLELMEFACATPARQVLELGCGGGMVGIVAALRNPERQITGIELCDEAADVARCNAYLHRARYTVLHGDLYEPVGGQRFDLILADPPSLPIPAAVTFPIYGAGGPEGHDLLKRIVTNAPAHLSADGQLFAITELHAATDDIPFLEWAAQWTKANRDSSLSISMQSSRRVSDEFYRGLGEGLLYVPGYRGTAFDTARTTEQMKTFAQRKQLNFGYWVHLHLQLNAGTPGFRLDWNFAKPSDTSRPRRTAEIGQQITALERLGLDQTPDVLPFLALADGGRTLEQIAIAMAANEQRFSRAHLGELSAFLHQIGLLEFG